MCAFVVQTEVFIIKDCWTSETLSHSLASVKLDQAQNFHTNCDHKISFTPNFIFFSVKNYKNRTTLILSLLYF